MRIKSVRYGKSDKRIEDFLKEFNTLGKIPVTKVQEWYKNQKGIPIRTFQFYCKEGLIPSPEFQGREGFYSLEDFYILRDIMYIVMWVKDSAKVRITKLRRVLRKYVKRKRELIDMLLNLTDEFPLYYTDEVDEEDFYDRICDEIWERVFSDLEKGIELDKYSILDVADEIRAQYR